MMNGVTAFSLVKSFKEAVAKKSILRSLSTYKRIVPIRYETTQYLVKTAEDGADLSRVLQLRHEIFIREWQSRCAFHGFDIDSYDNTADHLMIIEKSSSRVIGTYRLLSSHFTNFFYSSNEFELSEFLGSPGVKLEMGRACVHSDHRNGLIVDLLWRGLSQYIIQTGTRYLFGCSSVKSTAKNSIRNLMQTLKDQGFWDDRYSVRAAEGYEFPGVGIGSSSPLTPFERRQLIPPLLRSYLQAGAKVYGHPALDASFSCTDLLTILDWQELNPKFHSRFVAS